MLRDPSSTAIYDSINSRIINSNTGNPLSAIGYKNFKNSISLDTISKEALDMIRYNKDIPYQSIVRKINLRISFILETHMPINTLAWLLMVTKMAL